MTWQRGGSGARLSQIVTGSKTLDNELAQQTSTDSSPTGSVVAFVAMSNSAAMSQQWATLIAMYVESLKAIGRPPTTIGLRKAQLSQMARSLDCAPAAVTEDHIVRWFGSKMWEKETRRSYRSTVRGFFSYLHEHGDIESDPAANLKPIALDTPQPRPAPDYAWDTAIREATARVDLMARLAGEAGLRRGEVARVRTEDLDDSGSGPRLLVHGKGAKDRLIPISNALADRIRAGAAGHTPGAPASGWLFPTVRLTGDHLSPAAVGDLVSEVLPDGWTMHTLRHRFATRAYRATRNLRAVQILLGHASIATTQRYLAVDDDEMRAAMLGAAA